MKAPALFVLAVVLMVAPAARAEVMVSNLDDATLSTFPVGVAGSAGPFWAGNRFITDNSAASFRLDSVTLGMGAATETNSSFFVAIYTHGEGAPGSLLETLSGTTSPVAEGNYTFLSTGLSLAPNTSYWVVAGTLGSGGNYPWKVGNEEFTYTGPWVIPQTDTHITSFSAGGAQWNNLPNDGFPRKFSVSATVVPEPAAAAFLVAAGAPMLLALTRRRKR